MIAKRNFSSYTVNAEYAKGMMINYIYGLHYNVGSLKEPVAQGVRYGVWSVDNVELFYAGIGSSPACRTFLTKNEIIN